MIIRDFQTLKRLAENGRFVDEVFCNISSKDNCPEGNLYVTDGEDFDLLVISGEYFVVYEYEFSGTRKQFVDAQELWIFKEPPEDWKYNDLQFSDVIYVDDTPYNKVYEKNSESKSILSTLVRYKTSLSDFDTCFILESGHMDNEDGGFIQVFQGYQINKGDVEL